MKIYVVGAKMKIRNISYHLLNEVEKRIVNNHHKECLKLGCKNHEECKNVEDFWARHREIDTEYGKYDGWKE